MLLLGIVALGTLAAALLHGPALAGLGLIGAFLTPLIVATETPSYWALYLYLAVVTAAAFALARAKLWRWLAVSAVAASVLWALPGIGEVHAVAPHAAGAALVLAAAFAFATEILGRHGDRPGVQAAGTIFATGVIAALALALSFALEKGWLTVALALMVPGIAWIAEKRPWPALRWLAAAVTLGVLCRIAWDSRIRAAGSHTGKRPRLPIDLPFLQGDRPRFANYGPRQLKFFRWNE